MRPNLWAICPQSETIIQIEPPAAHTGGPFYARIAFCDGERWPVAIPRANVCGTHCEARTRRGY